MSGGWEFASSRTSDVGGATSGGADEVIAVSTWSKAEEVTGSRGCSSFGEMDGWGAVSLTCPVTEFVVPVGFPSKRLAPALEV